MRTGLLLLTFCVTLSSKAQLQINEVLVDNWFTNQDSAFDFSSWFEIKNTSNSIVSLSNYCVSDDSLDLSKWQLPDYELKPEEILLIYASGKDYKTEIHWNTVFYSQDRWRYFPTNEHIDSIWKCPEIDDSSWFLGSGRFGADNKIYNTRFDPSNFLYLRKDFQIYDLEEVEGLVFRIDFDDAFIAYLNGKEICQYNIDENSDPNRPVAKIKRHSILEVGYPPKEFVINSNIWEPVLKQGENVLAIKIINHEDSPDNILADPYLFVGTKNKENSYRKLTSWWTKANRSFDANFKIKEGEELFITSADNEIIDKVKIIESKPDYSLVRSYANESTWSITPKPSPGLPNEEVFVVDCNFKAPHLKNESGFYKKAVKLKLEDKLNDALVRYTTDGSIPNMDSEIFPSKLSIDSTTIIALRYFKEGCLPSKPSFYSFFINEQEQLPIASLHVDPYHFWDEDQGIYCIGKNADYDHPFRGANFWKSTELPVHFQYFDQNKNLEVDQTLGVKINGGGSRTKPMKSLRLSSKNKFGKKSIKHSFFDSKPNVKKFNRILLKNAGQCFNGTHLTDLFVHRLHENNPNLDTQAGLPVVVFINGKYWGVHNLREKFDKHYIKNNYGLSDNSISLVGGNGNYTIHGSNAEFLEIRDFVGESDMTVQANYLTAYEKIDIENFVDFQIANLFTANSDSERLGNVKFWKKNDKSGRWRYLLVDMDLTFGGFQDPAMEKIDSLIKAGHNFAEIVGPDFNELKYTFNQNLAHFQMLRSFWRNTNFRDYFVTRYMDLLNTTYTSKNMRMVLENIWQAMYPSMERHYNKWELYSMDLWENHFKVKLLDFIDKRPSYAMQNLKDFCELGKVRNISINFPSNLPEAGNCLFNTLELKENLSGKYFEGMEVTILPKANEGYEFSHFNINGKRVDFNGIILKYKIEEQNVIHLIYNKL